jgi:hypothetical protein
LQIGKILRKITFQKTIEKNYLGNNYLENNY